MRKTLYAAAAALALLAAFAPAAQATAPGSAAHPGGPAYIRIAGTHRCLTATHRRPGAPVLALRCRHVADQRWVIGHGVVRLAGTRLRMDISRRTWFTVLTLPGSWRDDWRLDRHHHLADLVLSRRLHSRQVLTLPGGDGHPLPGYRLDVVRFVPRFNFIGYQGIRLSS